ncbi:MAG: flagellar protein [Candidatus Hydrogenedentota bacterium]|nr:MAG: flagellar protein [Candidatus Hydrogenedentota bacterium]
MISLSRLNGAQFVLNAEIIQEVEATPDTLITLLSGKKLMVQEPVEHVIAAVIEYKRAVMQGVLPHKGESE